MAIIIMAQIFAFLKIIQDGVLPQQKTETIFSTNLLFRLHTKYCSTTLLIAAALLFIQQLFIEHLTCFRPLVLGRAMELPPLNQFCYTQGTYAQRNETSLDGKVIQSGTYLHNYFQWIPFILLLQGLTFHTPQLVWSKWVERGRLASYCSISPTVPTQDYSSQPLIPPSYPKSLKDEADTREMGTQTVHGPSTGNMFPFALSLKTVYNKKYFRGWVSCEFMNLVIIIFLTLVNDQFLGGRFVSLGPNWINYVLKLRQVPQDGGEIYTYLYRVEMSNPLEGIFPTLFTCHWTNPADSKVFHIHCIYGQNATHQRVYLTFWITFLLLILLDITTLIYRLLLTRSCKARLWFVQGMLIKKGVKSPIEFINCLKQLPVSDWFLMKRILQNVDPTKFDVIVHQVRNALKQRPPRPIEENGDIELQTIV